MWGNCQQGWRCGGGCGATSPSLMNIQPRRCRLSPMRWSQKNRSWSSCRRPKLAIARWRARKYQKNASDMQSFYLARKYKKKCKWFASPSPCIWLDVNKRHQLKRVVGNAQPKKRIWEICNQREEWIWLREQEKLTKGNDGQCKLEDKKDMGALQNQIIPTNFKLG